MFLQPGNSLVGAPPPVSGDIQDLLMYESFFDEYTTTGAPLDPTAATNLQQLQNQQLLQQQLTLQQQPQQQTQQLSPFGLQLQSLLAAQQHNLQQQQQQLQAQQQLTIQWALAQASANANMTANTTVAVSAANANLAIAATSPPDSAAFYNSPDILPSSLSPEADALMLPTSPGALSPNEDGIMLSPILLSTQSTFASANSDTTVKKEKGAANTAKRPSMDDTIDAEAKSASAATSKRSKKAPASAKATSPSSPKKQRTKKVAKNGSDQSDMEMSVSSSAASATPSPQTMPLQLPTSLATSGPAVTSASDMSTATTAGLFQTMPLLSMMPTSTMAPSSPGILPFGQPIWKMTPGMVLPPTMALPAAGFDPSTFTGAVVPGLDVSMTAGTSAQQTPATSQSGPTLQPGQPQPVQQKIPITRLKPPQALSTPPPAPSNAQSSQPTKQQKKVAHNAIERRYRNNINDRINDLKNVVPALCNIKTKDDKDDDDDDEPQDADGVARATKLNKATILRKATEYIIVLQKREQAIKSENAILKRLLTSLPGGVDLLEQHQGELANSREEISQPSESSSEDSNTESGSPPPAPGSSTGVSRVLMAVFMGVTFFTPPQGNPGAHQSFMDEGLGAGRAMSSSSRIVGHNPSVSGALGSSWGSFGALLTWDTWAVIRAIVFMGCLLTMMWGSYSSRGPFPQSKFPVMPKSSSPAQVYATLSGLVPKVIPSSYFRLFIALSLELWRCLWIRLGFYPDLTDMVRPDIWARVVEAQMSGGAGASVSRFMLLYTIVRTLDEYTNARRQPPARVSATAALAFYISLRKVAKPLATLVAQQFMESARYTARIFGTQDQWLESMLQVEVGSAVWNRSILEIESVMYGRTEYPQSESVLYQTMAPTRVAAQIQSVSILQDAYVDYMSRLNASTHGQDLVHSPVGRVAKFDDVVRATLPGTRHHWYALVGKMSELWLAKDEHSARLGDQLISRVMAMHPSRHVVARHDIHSALHHQVEEDDSSFQFYDQVIINSLLELAYLRRGMAGHSVRCGEKASSLLNKQRQVMGGKLPLGPVGPTGASSDLDEDGRAMQSVAYFAMNLTGFVDIKARIGLWRDVETLSSMVTRGDHQGEGDNEDVSQVEILDHIRATLLPLTVHLRHQLDDESTTELATKQMASSSTRNKGRRPVVDFDSALRFLIDIGRVAYGAWEDGSDGSDSGCGSGGEEEEGIQRTMQPKACLATKRSDAETAWELCLEL
ncbi:MAG: hypothetical protein J3Q66DRAFT_384810 [Benniella sp.]|nr:MAG: hypothetical protein J3Q66DRAFT_384810 [Benniella sp.]